MSADILFKFDLLYLSSIASVSNNQKKNYAYICKITSKVLRKTIDQRTMQASVLCGSDFVWCFQTHIIAILFTIYTKHIISYVIKKVTI